MEEMRATGAEICDRLTGRPLRVLAARPTCKFAGCCSFSRLMVKARARDIVEMVVG